MAVQIKGIGRSVFLFQPASYFVRKSIFLELFISWAEWIEDDDCTRLINVGKSYLIKMNEYSEERGNWVARRRH